MLSRCKYVLINYLIFFISLEFGTKYPSPPKDMEAEGRNRKGKGRANFKKKRVCQFIAGFLNND